MLGSAAAITSAQADRNVLISLFLVIVRRCRILFNFRCQSLGGGDEIIIELVTHITEPSFISFHWGLVRRSVSSLRGSSDHAGPFSSHRQTPTGRTIIRSRKPYARNEIAPFIAAKIKRNHLVAAGNPRHCSSSLGHSERKRWVIVKEYVDARALD